MTRIFLYVGVSIEHEELNSLYQSIMSFDAMKNWIEMTARKNASDSNRENAINYYSERRASYELLIAKAKLKNNKYKQLL